jgi:hypothetical protein
LELTNAFTEVIGATHRVRFGSLADIGERISDVRLPEIADIFTVEIYVC